MMISNPVYTPLINTIPDDTMLFCMLDPNTEIAQKVIVENYVNFYAKRHPYVGDVIFRFENLIDYESIQGIKRVFISHEFLERLVMNPEYLIDLLERKYYINMPVSRKAIAFYETEFNDHHHMLIYGVDTEQKEFLCKDYRGRSFVSFRCSFEELIQSAKIYSNPYATESNGMLAYKIDDETNETINYSKLCVEFTKLKNEYVLDDLGTYGVNAIDLFDRDICKAPIDSRYFYRWYETANFLRESSKLMNFRLECLSRILGSNDTQYVALKKDLSDLFQLTSGLFFTVSISERSKKFDSTRQDYIHDQLLRSKSVFQKVAEGFINLIENRD